jgi:hypothetical protein
MGFANAAQRYPINIRIFLFPNQSLNTPENIFTKYDKASDNPLMYPNVAGDDPNIFMINSAENAVMITDAEFEKKLTMPTIQIGFGKPNMYPFLSSRIDNCLSLLILINGSANCDVLLT